MSPAISTLSTLAVVLAISFCSVLSDEAIESEKTSLSHQPQKRSAMLLEPDMTSGDEAFADEAPYFLDDSSAPDNKRSSLFRFGKRGGSLFRFGKRGSLFRFGKRGSLFRFGKRGGALFRFGRSYPVDNALDEEMSYPRSNLDMLREAMENAGYPSEELPSKRSDYGFHWGHE